MNPYRTNTKVKLGCVARDTLTGFEGVVIGRTEYISNCPRYAIQPTKPADGKPIDVRWFDEMNLEFVKDSSHVVTPEQRPADPVFLSDVVKDGLMGVKGTVVSITTWSNGCSRIGVQPKGLKNGVPADVVTCDEKDLRIIERKGTRPPPPVKTGGPRPAPTRR